MREKPIPFFQDPIYPPRNGQDWKEYNQAIASRVNQAREIFDSVDPTCASTIGGANYESILNPLSRRYYDNVPNIDATVLTQPSSMQVPAAFVRKGGEYRNAEFMDMHSQPSVYTGAGFVPGRMDHSPGTFDDLNALPKDTWPVYLQDNPSVAGRLLYPAIKNTLSFGSLEAHERGRLVAQYQLGADYDDDLTRLTIPRPINTLTQQDVADILSDPRRSCTADMGLLVSSLDNNNLDTSCLSRTEAVGGEMGGIAAAPAGLRAQTERDKYNRQVWSMLGSGCMKGMDQQLVADQNNALVFASMRARLANPQGQLYSGPITESMDQDSDSTMADAFQFYNSNWVQPSQFSNQTNLSMRQLYP